MLPIVHVLIPLTLSALLLTQASVAQIPLRSPGSEASPGATPAATTAVAGAIAPERWIVQLRTRSFDLQAVRGAIYARRPAHEVTALLTDIEERMRADQAPFVAAVEQTSARVVRQWWIINAVCVEGTAAQIEAVRNLARVHRVDRDTEVHTDIGSATNSANHNADLLQAFGHSGEGVAVAVLDSGFDANMNSTGRPHATFSINGNPQNTSGGGIGGSRLHVRQIGSQPSESHALHGTFIAAVAAGAGWSLAASDDGHAPSADIVGYALTDLATGQIGQATIISAWQEVAVDRAAHNIAVANMSITGFPDAAHPTNQAMDVVARDFDVLCSLSAGNLAGNTASAKGATNCLTVGAVTLDAHQVWASSARGPLHGDPTRNFPALVACGVDIASARPDIEALLLTASGTSAAAPMVGGAAAQLRARFPALTALETKAALLAGTADIGWLNPGLTNNDFGTGLLKNDRTHQIVASNNVHTDTIQQGQTELQAFPVVAGHRYAMALTWHRTNVTSNSWSNLDLTVRHPTTSAVVAVSDTPRNLFEVVRFTSSHTGTMDVEISAPSIPGGSSQSYAWAWLDVDAPARDVVTYGSGCPGTGTAYEVLHEVNPGLDPVITPSVSYPVSTRLQAFLVSAPTGTTTTIRGIELLAQSRDDVERVSVSIYSVSPGTFPPQPGFYFGQTATLFAGSSPRYGRALFASPVSVTGPFFVVCNVHSEAVDLDVAGAAAVTAYVDVGVGGSTWQPIPTRPSFRVLGDNANPTPGAVPHARVQAGTLAMVFGGFTDIELSEARPSTVAICAIGWSETATSLAALGAPCTLLTSAEVLNPVIVDPSGQASFSLFLPQGGPFLGVELYSQYVTLDGAANTLGLAFSNGLRLSAGN